MATATTYDGVFVGNMGNSMPLVNGTMRKSMSATMWIAIESGRVPVRRPVEGMGELLFSAFSHVRHPRRDAVPRPTTGPREPMRIGVEDQEHDTPPYDQRDEAHDDGAADVGIVEDFLDGDDADDQHPDADHERDEGTKERDNRQDVEDARRRREANHAERLLEIRLCRGFRHDLRADDDDKERPDRVADQGHDHLHDPER